jgi:aerobic-type carbon monoxide dehydrogenase small subunit (CoxS/CutS family)|tara:strand:- start:1151 stop:1606 length:456 start_codon:yes stop_codon:yes gene_type:complete
MISLTVNGQTRTVEAAPDTPLLWVLREHLGLTGTKYGCGTGECGACNVYMNGEVVQSCQSSVGKSSGADITTIEGLGANGLHPVQKAWIEENVVQCGYCMPGMIMASAAMLDTNPEPTDQEIDVALKDNLCRCGAYARIRKAIHKAASSMA